MQSFHFSNMNKRSGLNTVSERKIKYNDGRKNILKVWYIKCCILQDRHSNISKTCHQPKSLARLVVANSAVFFKFSKNHSYIQVIFFFKLQLMAIILKFSFHATREEYLVNMLFFEKNEWNKNIQMKDEKNIYALSYFISNKYILLIFLIQLSQDFKSDCCVWYIANNLQFM